MAAVADGHAPLLAQIRALAGRARIPLQPRGRPVASPSAEAQALAPFGLTSREVAVLRLLATGRTNAQIGAELYIRRSACTSATSCASSASPAGCRPPPWPNVPVCCYPRQL
jgi:hypothetical protein